MASRIEKAASGFEEASRNIAAALSDAAVGLSQRMGRQAEDNSAKLAKQFEGMLAELRSLAEASRATGQDALRGLAEQVSSSASGFERTVAKVAEALANAAANTGGTFGRGAEAAVGRIAEATEGMRSELLAMLSEFRGSLGKAGNDLRQAGEAGAASLKGALDAAGMEVAGAVKIAADRLAEAGNTTASSLERGGEAASANIVAASGGFADGARALASRVGEISRAGEGIVNRLVELDKAARDAAQPLTGVSTDLKTASQTALCDCRIAKCNLADAGALDRAISWRHPETGSRRFGGSKIAGWDDGSIPEFRRSSPGTRPCSGRATKRPSGIYAARCRLRRQDRPEPRTGSDTARKSRQEPAECGRRTDLRAGQIEGVRRVVSSTGVGGGGGRWLFRLDQRSHGRHPLCFPTHADGLRS